MDYQTINRSELKQRLASDEINNDDSSRGTAVVNVLGADVFERKHIPNSINIPVDELDRFESRFDKDKDIVVYCASTDCDASPRAASALAERGFSNIYDYPGGMADWEKGNQPVAGREAIPGPAPS